MNSFRTAGLANVFRGILMGGADIIPGVSGGTVALILGIYERLVTAISHVDTRLLGLLRHCRWSEAAVHIDLRFLVTLVCGILLGVAGLATLMNHLIDHHPQPTLAVFFGLILASSVLVARMVGRWNAVNAVLLVAGMAVAYWLVAQPVMAGREGYAYLFFCGMVAICAMILPGISGAFILLILGKYTHVTGAISSLVRGDVTVENLLTLVVFACGCVVGLLSFSKFLRWLLAHHHAPTMAVLCGFMIGSLRRLWPFKGLPSGEAIDFKHNLYPNVWPEEFNGQVAWVVVLAVASMASVLLLDSFAKRRHQKVTSEER
ncbi:MAG: DUF368 domain-containing protein [Pirellulales bacterium]|nr:DUF368 domain-containing protein [Pirellulales bacterium]